MTGTRAALIVLLALAALAAAILVGGGAEPVPLDSSPDAASASRRAPVGPGLTPAVVPATELRSEERAPEVVVEMRAPSGPDDPLPVDVTVVVRDDLGAPVAGVDVRAAPELLSLARVLEPKGRTGVTGGAGRCTLRLVEGTFWIRANLDERAPQLTSESAQVDVARATEEVFLTLRRRGGFVRVICVDGQGLPAEGVRMELTDEHWPEVTGPNGVVTFSDLPAGPHVLEIEANERWSVPSDARRRELELAPGVPAVVRVDLVRNGWLDVRLVPPPPPGEEVAVRVRSLESDDDFRDERAVWEFASLGLFPGAVELVAVPTADSELWGARPVIATVRPGERTPVDVPLDRHAGVVSGRVVDPAGRAVEGAPVEVDPDGGAVAKRIVAREGGRFRVRGVPPGPLEVRATGTPATGLGQTGIVRLDGPRVGVEVRLRRLFDIEGVVRLPERGWRFDRVDVEFDRRARLVRSSGDPVRTTQLRRDRSDPTRQTFAFRGLSAGSYRVILEPSGAAADVTLGPGSPDATTLAFDAPAPGR